MKATVRDVAALHAIKPLEAAAYLRTKGWRQEAERNGKSSLWLLDDEFDLTLPLHRDLADYAIRIGEVLHTLAQAEQRSELEVLRDLQTSATDLIRVRVPSRGMESGTLPLDKAPLFVERSRDMMLAAACAALSKRAVHPRRKPEQAMAYLEQAQMGQTEQGSYVLTILSPVTPKLKISDEARNSLTEPAEPYERRVTRTLFDALGALGEAAREAGLHGDMKPFEAAVAHGVSANLCEAVTGLSNIGADGMLDVQVTWSRSRPVEVNLPTRIFLDSDSMNLIEEAGRRLRATATLEDYELQGVITRLRRGADETEGDVTITGSIDGKMRTVTVRLDAENYSKAAQAHDERRVVTCTGELVQEGQSYRLQNPRSLAILLEA